MSPLAAHRFPAWLSGIVLIGLTMLSGVCAAMLSPGTTLLLFGLVALGVLALIEPINGIVVLLLVAPLKALIAAESTAAGPLDIGQIAFLGVIGIWIIQKVAQRQPVVLPLSRVYIPLLIIIVSSAASLPAAISVSASVAEIVKWLEMLALIALCLALFDRSNVSWLVFALVLAGSVQAVVGLYEFFGGSGAEHLWILDQRYFRAFGTFGQPNPFGALMGLTLPFSAAALVGHLGMIWRKQNQREVRNHAILTVLFYALTSALLLAGLLASWSRGAWMGFAASAVVMLVFVPRSWVRSMLLLGAVILLAASVWMSGMLPDAVTQRLSGFVGDLTTLTDVRGVDITNDNYAVTERIAHWQAAIAIAESRPWLGVGLGNYETAYPDYALMNWPMPLGHAHNYYLNLLAEVGVIGTLAYLAAWGIVFALTLRVWARSTGIERAWSVALIGAWTYHMTHSFVDKLYVNNLFLHLGCMLGVLAVLLKAVGTEYARSASIESATTQPSSGYWEDVPCSEPY